MTQLKTPPPPVAAAPPPPPPKQQAGGAKVVIAALAMAILAVLILSFYIQSVRNEVAKQKFTVFVLTRNIRPGDRLSPKDWKAVEVPEQFRESFESLQAYVGRDTDDDRSLRARSQSQEGSVFERAASKNDLVTEILFDRPADLKDLQIDPGKVRIALPIKSKLTPGGLRPGMYVNIAAPMMTGGTVAHTMLVLHHVRIKAVGKYTLVEEEQREGQALRSFNSVSIDVDEDVALMLSTLEKMVRPIGDFELFIADPGTELPPEDPNWKPGKINPKVVELVRKHLPAS